MHFSQEESVHSPSDEPAPTHVGALAGLTAEERIVALNAHMGVDGEQAGEECQRRLEGDTLQHAPVRTLQETLALKTKKALCETARNLGCSGYSKLRKERLVVFLEQALIWGRSHFAERFACSTFPGMLDQARRVWSAGGMLEMGLQEHRALPPSERFHAYFPLMNVFEHGEKVSCVIPNEVMEELTEDCWESARERMGYLEHAWHMADVYVNRCGLVREDELVDLYQRYYPAELGEREFCMLLHCGGPGHFNSFNLWCYGGEWYFIHPALLSDKEIEEFSPGKARIYGELMIWPTRKERFRRHVLECHEEIEPWEVPSRTAQEFESFNPDAIMETPSHRALQAFLDAHVPEGQDDYLWADKFIEGLVTMARCGCGDADYLIALMNQGLHLEGADVLLQVSDLVEDFVGDVPCWLDNGWSPKALEGAKRK